MSGVLFLIVGPSGAGKDSLLDGARVQLARDPHFVFARRIITRPADAGGEAHEAVTEEEFEARLTRDEFLAHWRAHDLGYGLSGELAADLAEGRHVLANISRGAIAGLAERHSEIRVIEVTAPPEILAARLAARGREDAADIQRRITRKPAAYPKGVEVLTIQNDGSIEAGVEQFVRTINQAVPGRLKIRRMPLDTWRENICFLHRDCTVYNAENYLGPAKVDIFTETASLRARVNLVEDGELLGLDEVGLSSHSFETLGLPEGSEVLLERTPSPESLRTLRAKVGGAEIGAAGMSVLIRDIVEYRYTEREIAAFLVTASKELTAAEIQGLTRARAAYAHRFSWERDIVVDKHSMGGVPGSRISLIVIPIVAAHGLWIPKTSSRAITSAAGTADVMECLARVDLTPADVQRTVETCNGCIAWNGRLSHSPVDDVMNSITRPLGIDSSKLAVTSILSKKLAAGSTHAIIDIPVGPRTKVANEEEGQALARLFEEVGSGVGLTIKARVTDGAQPIGRGLGPALEVRDVYQVLRNEPDAPADLRAKALDFAAAILEWAPDTPVGSGRALAGDLLESGAALETLERMIDLQGRRETPPAPGPLVHEVAAAGSGTVSALDSYRLSGIARRAGAPMDKGAGVDLLKSLGDTVSAGEPLYLISANVETDFRIAMDAAETSSGFTVT